MTETIEAVVIGAGVVGLSVARALALSGRETLILEAADRIGSEISSRNSEVIHAGIYYSTGSLKARLCVTGRNQLYAYCESRGVPYRRLGKLIVATDASQMPALRALKEKAAENGVDDLIWLDGPAARALEPELDAAAALLSPSTGIVDSHSLMLSYQGEAESAGASLALRSPVRGSAILDDGFRLDVGGSAEMQLNCRYLVNAGGLSAQSVAGSMEGFDAAFIPRLHLAKGNYFTLAGASPFRRLIYPMPEGAGLGVHLTLDIAGQARFGPDVEWVGSIEYAVDPARADVFYAAIRRYWPGLKDAALIPGYSGIRPKLNGPGKPAADFLVQGRSAHGVRNLVNLFGIESPGLTSSLALGDLVAAELNQ